ncbi:1385_t:CDS:2, partial [Cetraspora pellucida]
MAEPTTQAVIDQNVLNASASSAAVATHLQTQQQMLQQQQNQAFMTQYIDILKCNIHQKALTPTGSSFGLLFTDFGTSSLGTISIKKSNWSDLLTAEATSLRCK